MNTPIPSLTYHLIESFGFIFSGFFFLKKDFFFVSLRKRENMLERALAREHKQGEWQKERVNQTP